MKSVLTMSITKISEFLNAFEAHGINKEEALKSANINPSALESPDNRLSAAEVDRIMQGAVGLTNNENIGLCQGELLSKGFSSILGYILMNCGTLGEATEKYRQYEKIVDETSITDLKMEDGFVVLSTTTIDKMLAKNRQFSDFKIAGTLSYIKLLTGEWIVLKEVYFTHRKPKDTSEYQRIFQCPVFFEKSTNALVFDYESLNLPIIEPSKELLSLFEKNAQETLNAFESNETYTKKVTGIILKEMKGDIPSIHTVAQKLAMSVRNLQIYLKSEGASYIRLVNEIRRDMAVSYLKEKNVSIGEIAYILGFSETSAFHRAFKKWTGITPREFRTGKVFNQGFSGLGMVKTKKRDIKSCSPSA